MTYKIDPDVLHEVAKRVVGLPRFHNFSPR
jgi:tRNA U38,U39,U40 pseudouridine synthase TruA